MSSSPNDPAARPADWEAFYRDYRKPDYVPGFEITSKLGGGMFGLVFRARRMSIGKDYAIKFLQVEDEQVRKAVLAELEQVKWFAQIDHPNLVSIEDRGEVDGIPYLVMAFAGTETLRDKLVAGRVPSPAEKDDLLRWFLQACRGLSALHERSLVHFDIKPANVFLKGAVARLGDYGLSKLVTHSRGSLSMGRGTPYYMAPELLQRRGDHRSDVYSLGVMLYELLCGAVPFTGDSEWEVLKKHETQRPEMPAHLSAREQAILQRCLQKDPGARYQSVHDLIAAFGAPASAGDAAVGGIAAVANGGTADVAARAHPVALADCLPVSPPLVAKAPPPLPRRSRLGVQAVVVLGVVAMMVLWISEGTPARARTKPPVMQRPPAPSAVQAQAHTVAAKIDQLVGGLLRTVRGAVQKVRRTALRDVEEDRFALPRDFDAYREQLDALASSPHYSEVAAKKLEKLGRPGFVAGIALLHDLDYDEGEDCQRASNVLRFLGQQTGIQGLDAVANGCEPGEADTCRFLALADGWRRIADQFARTDAAFRELLTARGKAAAGARAGGVAR
jgi:hypothetical protein